MKRLNTSNRLILLVAVLTSLLLVVGTFGLVGIYRANDALKTVYLDRTVPMWQLSEIQRLMARNWLIVAIAQDTRSSEFVENYIHDAESNLITVHKLYDQYLQTNLTPEEALLAEKFRLDLENFESEGLAPALAAIKVRDFNEVRRLELEVMLPYSVPFRNNLHALTKFQLDVSGSVYKAAMARFENMWLVAIFSMVAGVAFSLIFGGFLVRSIIQSRLEFQLSELAKRDLERQLQQSQKVQALGQLTGGIAHDFNNILAAILGYSNLALDRHVPDKQSKLAKYLREISAAGERASDLISKMLTFARTQPSDDLRMISAAAVVREVESMMTHSIPARIAFHSDCDEDFRILIDPGELNQVLVNLVINARDAIRSQGSITIHLHKIDVANEISHTSQKRFSGEFIAVDVSDTGMGIAIEQLPRLFEPFYTTKDVGLGSGLGLSMVQGIMRRAGGHILVHSIPGKGSRFRLLFPILSLPEIAAPEPVTTVSAPLGQGQLIWIVDDEAALTEYLGDLLKGWGFQVRQFNDPREAINAFAKAAADVHVVITDMTMPGLSGMDLVSQLRSIDGEIPVILCTGFGEGVDPTDVSRLGIDKLLLKPVSMSELASALSAVLPNLSPGIHYRAGHG